MIRLGEASAVKVLEEIFKAFKKIRLSSMALFFFNLVVWPENENIWHPIQFRLLTVLNVG